MIHPHTQLRFISDQVGHGVFATQFIPKGSITYIKDSLEIEVTPERFFEYEPSIRAVIEKYSYMDDRGIRIVSWDHAKYVNHCCHCNTMSTGYGFEIAIRDIQPGEEITDEYGMFNLDFAMELVCSRPNCRGQVSAADLEKYYHVWDDQIRGALDQLRKVEQPLWSLLDEATLRQLDQYLHTGEGYVSVLSLRHAVQNGQLFNRE